MIAKIKKIIIKVVKKDNILYKDIVINRPKYQKFGDYSFNVLEIAKTNKLNPYELAIRFAKQIKLREFQIKVIKPGYINFFLDDKYLIKNLNEIIEKKDNYKKKKEKKNKNIIVDYSSPNIAKPMGVGHLRSTIIGQFICNIYRYLGYQTYGINHLGDWGTQFGKLIYAYKKWGNSKKDISIKDMLDLYIKFHKEVENNPQIEDIAKEEFKNLENKTNKENEKIWQLFREKSIKDFNKMYELLDIIFTYPIGKYAESFYDEKRIKSVIKILKNKKLIKKSQGALIINLNKKYPPMLLEKSDGATLYATRELAALKYRIDKYNPKKIIYVVGNEQKLHLKQLEIVAKKIGFKTKIIHIEFGLIRFNDKKMSTRRGNIIFLEDIINKSIQKAQKIVREKNLKLKDKEIQQIVKTIGIASIKYNDLSQNRNTDIVFNYDKMLSLKGNSASYLIYTYARAKNILKLGKYENKKINCLNIDADEEEKNILRKLALFEDVLKETANKYLSNILTDYLYDLANMYNNFYQTHPVIKSDSKQKKIRFGITYSVSQILKISLDILGIKTLEKI